MHRNTCNYEIGDHIQFQVFSGCHVDIVSIKEFVLLVPSSCGILAVHSNLKKKIFSGIFEIMREGITLRARMYHLGRKSQEPGLKEAHPNDIEAPQLLSMNPNSQVIALMT